MAAKDITSHFSQGSAVIELGYRIGDSPEVTPLTGKNVIVEESIINEGINMPSRHTHIVRAKTPDYTDKLLHAIMQDGTPQVQVRAGIVSGDKQSFLPWQNHQVVYYKATPHQDGHDIRLDTADALFTAGRIDQKIRARRGLVSDIITAIASENNISALVEPTKGNGGEIYIQSLMDDVTFIIQRMLPKAINSSGQGSYRLFVKDNILHFHGPAYQADIHQLDYFNKSASMSLHFSDNSQGVIIYGAAGSTALVHDPYTGTSQTVRHDPAHALNFSKVTPTLSKNLNADQPIAIHVGANRIDEIQALVQNTYENAYSSMYEIELKMASMLFVRLNDMINILVRPDQAKSSPWSGLFTITKVEHTIVKGVLESKFTMNRGEQSSQGRNFKGLASLGIQDLVIKENFAVGQAINVAEIKGSQETAAATGQSERLASGQVVKTVQRP